MYNDYDDDDQEVIRVEMAYGLIHDAVLEMLNRQNIIKDFGTMTKHLYTADTPKTIEMKNEILQFLEDEKDAVLDATANFLIRTAEPLIANAAIPILNSVAIATTFNNGSRLIQIVKVILSTLCNRTFDVDGVETPYIKCGYGSNGHWYFKSCITDMPSIKDGYRLPSQKPLAERKICDHVTGSIMNKVENLNSDKCLEILGYLMSVKLKYSNNFMNRAEMILKQDASDDEKEAFEQYTQKLAEPIKEIMHTKAYFYTDLITDYRLRIYSRLDSVNYTSSKQIRSMLEAYDKEMVKITEIKVDPNIKVTLPEL